MSDSLDGQRTPWLTWGLDWEGVAAALAALLLALLLGWIWSPLFWLGFVLMVVVLFASRYAKRTPPELANAIIAPCDGRIVSIEPADVPEELRLSGAAMTRIRITSAPSATNRIYAPISGGLKSVILLPGDSSVVFAARPDDDGLVVVNLGFESLGQHVGVRLASGGFGPRIDVQADAGDAVLAGKPVAVRRLGGWCDVYVPENVGPLVWVGQSVVGGETVMGRLKRDDEDATENDASATPDDEIEPAEEAEEAAETVSDDEESAIEDLPEPDEVDTPEDPAVMLARIKETSRQHLEE